MFMYVNFMQMRYFSRKNKYPREAWGKLRVVGGPCCTYTTTGNLIHS